MSRGAKGADPAAAALALNVLHTVERRFVPAAGPVEARALNQSGFEALCREMGLVNADWGGRLFAAIDADNTGAIDAFEYLDGLRVMGALGPPPAAQSAAAGEERRALAFRMLDVSRPAPHRWRCQPRVRLTLCVSALALLGTTLQLDRDGKIGRDELRDFLRSFATAAREVTEGWVGQVRLTHGALSQHCRSVLPALIDAARPRSLVVVANYAVRGTLRRLGCLARTAGAAARAARPERADGGGNRRTVRYRGRIVRARGGRWPGRRRRG